MTNIGFCLPSYLFMLLTHLRSHLFFVALQFEEIKNSSTTTSSKETIDEEAPKDGLWKVETKP